MTTATLYSAARGSARRGRPIWAARGSARKGRPDLAPRGPARKSRPDLASPGPGEKSRPNEDLTSSFLTDLLLPLTSMTIVQGYLFSVLIWTNDDLAYAREVAFKRDQSVEDFRADELRQIKRIWNPHRRFYAHRHLDEQCERLWKDHNFEKWKRGQPQEPVYKPFNERPEWAKWRKVIHDYYFR